MTQGLVGYPTFDEHLAQTLQTNPFFAAYLIKAQYSCQSWSNCLCTACPIVVRVQPVYLF